MRLFMETLLTDHQGRCWRPRWHGAGSIPRQESAGPSATRISPDSPACTAPKDAGQGRWVPRPGTNVTKQPAVPAATVSRRPGTGPTVAVAEHFRGTGNGQ